VRHRFWYISLPSSGKQRQEMIKLKVLRRAWTYDSEFRSFLFSLSLFFFNLNTVSASSVLGTFNLIQQFKNVIIQLDLPQATTRNGRSKWSLTRVGRVGGFKCDHEATQVTWSYALKWRFPCRSRSGCLSSLLLWIGEPTIGVHTTNQMFCTPFTKIH